MADEFLLRIAGLKYDGWTSLSVRRSIEEMAHSFSATLTDRWAPDQERVPVKAGDQVIVALNGQNITVGYIDEDSSSYAADSQELSVSGRSKTADLIDCAAVYKTGQWSKQGLLKIAKDLATPFGINVNSHTSLGDPFNSFSIQDGETAFATIDRAARMKGVLALTDGEGHLYFDRTGSTKLTTVLERGKNIVTGAKTNSWKDRFSRYTVKTQIKGDYDFGDGPGTTVKRSSVDDGVDRYRPFIMQAENEDSAKELQTRADWERNVRAGRSVRLTYSVQGWEHQDGLWEPNKIVRVVDNYFNVDDELLIVSATQKRDTSGTTTELELAPPVAFTVEPLPPKKQKALMGGLFQ